MTKNNIIKTFPPTVIAKMKQFYQDWSITSAPPGAVFLAKLDNVTITAYQKSGKVMFQGANAEYEASIWGGEEQLVVSKENSQNSSHNYEPPANVTALSLIGSDETGTGDYFGPITVVAAYVAPENRLKCQNLGVKDSKLLSDQEILDIAEELMNFIPFSLLVLRNRQYNELQQSGKNQGELKARLHEQAITKLLERIAPVTPDAVLIDQFCSPNTYFKYINGKPNRSIPTYFKTKAESFSLSVAAASIIARTAFIKEMDIMSEKLGHAIPKGASHTVDQFAAKIMMEQGIETLNDYAKMHFANTQKAKLLAEKQ